ncbi:MAG: hypothetical protein FWE58_01415 [Methanobrevibacter sp.]|nr:hypothetical protein [Methanobrevibacter sp.]
MDKSLIFIIILFILGVIVASNNTEPIHNIFLDVKSMIQGEANKEPIAKIGNYINISNNSNSQINTSNNTNENSKNNMKTYNNDGVYFKYPSYWDYNQFSKLVSLYQKEHLSRWDDGLIFYISDRSLKEELEYQKNYERYKNPKNISVDGRKAVSLTDTKKDYWHYLIIVEKNENQSYVFIFYTDRDLKTKNKVLFDEILATMRLN